jgi:hypothetical protein
MVRSYPTSVNTSASHLEATNINVTGMSDRIVELWKPGSL